VPVQAIQAIVGAKFKKLESKFMQTATRASKAQANGNIRCTVEWRTYLLHLKRLFGLDALEPDAFRTASV
jgi:hypothetical protein